MPQLEVILGQGEPRVKVGGNTYKLSPLKLRDFGAFRDWVKERRLAVFLRAAKASGMDPKAFQEAIQKILAVSPTVKETQEGETEVEDDVLGQMSTEEGMQYLVYLSLRKNHPDLEPEDLDLGFEDLAEISTIISQISGLPTGAEVEANTLRPPQEEREGK